MPTKITQQEWSLALEVFRASLPKRGAKSRDDLLFLEVMHYLGEHDIKWRALPERFGNWNSIWKRFNRLNKAGAFKTFFDRLAELPSTAHLVQRFDSKVVRRRVPASAEGDDKPSRLVPRPVDSRRKSL